ncbi:MAG: alpha/beta fold hydrolase [Polyangiales bacterium]
MGDPPSNGAAPAPEFAAHDLLLRGIRVRYHEGGEGAPLLLVHGLFTDHRAWMPAAEKLAREFRVIVPDLPGAGASEKPTRYAFTRDALADTLCDLLAGVGAPRAHVAGMGLGGLVALTLAADRPELVERLVLVSTVAVEAQQSFRTRLAAVPVFGPFVFKQVYGRSVLHGYFRGDVFAPGFRCDPALLDDWCETFDLPEARECQWRMLTRAEADVSALGPRLPKVSAPTLVLWGDKAPRASVTVGQRLAHELRGGRLEVIAGAGHAPPLEQPEATADAMRRHLAIPLSTRERARHRNPV